MHHWDGKTAFNRGFSYHLHEMYTKKFGQPAASQMSRARLRCNLSAALRPYAA